MIFKDAQRAELVINETNQCEKQDAMIYLFGLL